MPSKASAQLPPFGASTQLGPGLAAEIDDWFPIVNSSAIAFPGGAGTAAAKEWGSICINEDVTLVRGITLVTLPAAVRTLEIRDATDTTTLYSLTIPQAIAGQLWIPQYIPIGRLGVPIRGHWGVKLGGADYTAHVWFSRGSKSTTPARLEPFMPEVESDDLGGTPSY